MDVLTYIAIGLSSVAAICAVSALIITLSMRRRLMALQTTPVDNKNEFYAEIANLLSDGSMVWQRLMVESDELSAMISTTLLKGVNKENIGDWLLQLREFCKKSKAEIDHAYQLFSTEAKNMSSEEMEMQMPDMAKFNKEMKSNVAVISDQLDHMRSILRGGDADSNRQFKITLHKPQVMPHFLRKRQKIAELQRRRLAPQTG